MHAIQTIDYLKDNLLYLHIVPRDGDDYGVVVRAPRDFFEALEQYYLGEVTNLTVCDTEYKVHVGQVGHQFQPWEYCQFIKHLNGVINGCPFGNPAKDTQVCETVFDAEAWLEAETTEYPAELRLDTMEYALRDEEAATAARSLHRPAIVPASPWDAGSTRETPVRRRKKQSESSMPAVL